MWLPGMGFGNLESLCRFLVLSSLFYCFLSVAIVINSVEKHCALLDNPSRFLSVLQAKGSLE